MTDGPDRMEYVLPIRWSADEGLADLAGYVEWLAGYADVIVVDGSEPEARRRHAAAMPPTVRFLECDSSLCLNGKAAGVLTAVPWLRRAKTIIADDDVRYSAENLEQVAARLDRAALVRPQNVFSPLPGRSLPWHARWDTARTLLNRACGADYPGTLGVRTEFLAGGYDGDVLFENLELIRTVRARGGTAMSAGDLYVDRLPPTLRGFAGQRLRQAYDSTSQPARFAAELSILPVALAASRRPALLIGGAVGSVLLAEAGRRRAGGAEVFEPRAALWAPLWLFERGVCAWFALFLRARGGVDYRGTRLVTAARSIRSIRKHEQEGSR